MLISKLAQITYIQFNFTIYLTNNTMIEISNNIMHNDNDNDINDSIENGISNNIARINDYCMLDIIKADKSLKIFFIFNGYYNYEESDHIAIRISAISWQIILLTLGAIGFILQAFWLGGLTLANLCNTNYSSSENKNELFFQVTNTIYTFLVPILQVGSLIYGTCNIKRQLRQSVDSVIATNLLSSYQLQVYFYYISMAMLVVIINPLNINKSVYPEYQGFGIKTYSIFVFQQVSLLFFNLAVTSYLVLMLLFTLLTLGQVKLLLKDTNSSIDNNSLTCNDYFVTKEKLKYLKKESNLSIQILTISAGCNAIIFVFQLFVNNSNEYLVPTYSDIILANVHMIPYILKEIVFFFYVLLEIATINSLNKSLLLKINNKCWQENQKKESDIHKLNDYLLIHIDAHSMPMNFTIGTIEVRRSQVLTTLIGFTLYIMYIFFQARRYL